MNELDLHGLTHDIAVDRAEDFVLMESHNELFEMVYTNLEYW
jgi:hypothetical protein